MNARYHLRPRCEVILTNGLLFQPPRARPRDFAAPHRVILRHDHVRRREPRDIPSSARPILRVSTLR